MKKPTINQIVIWVAQATVVGFILPTIFGFFISPNGILPLEGSFFLIPIILGLIGFSIIGESVASIVMGLTGFILLIMLICVIFFKRAMKYGVFLFAILLLDLTTMIAWFKSEIFEAGYVNTNFYIHLAVMAILIAGMTSSYFTRTLKQQKDIEKEELVEAEVEFEVEHKLSDPESELKENTEDSVSSDS
jgi:hypothetical protein